MASDTHFPFVCKKSLAKIYRRLSEKKFDYIVQIGDLLDQYCFSKFPKSNIKNADLEIKRGREMALKMWDTISTLQKKAKKIQLLGNHDNRMILRCKERMPEAQNVVRNSLLELYKFDGVKTITDSREEFSVGNIVFIHGYKTKIGDHTKWLHANVCRGHSHRAGIAFIPIKNKILWELDVGFMADVNHEALSYTQTRTTNWTIGHGEISNGVPAFIPHLK